MGWAAAGLNLKVSPALCVVTLNSDFSAGTNVFSTPVTQWKSTADKDTHSMYHYNSGGSTWIQVPFKGKWLIHAHTIWYNFGAFNGSLGVPFITAVQLNGTGASNIIHTKSAQGFRDNTCAYETFTERVLSAGDKVNLGFLAQYGGTVKVSNLTTTNRTTMELRWVP